MNIKTKISRSVWASSLLVFLLFGQVSVAGQSSSEQVQALLDSSYQVSRYDYEKCIEFVDSAVQYTANHNQEYYQNLALYYRGVCNHRHGNYDESLENFNEGIAYFAQLKDTTILSDLYYQKSLIFRQQSDYKQFLENVNTSLRLAEAIGYDSNVGMCNNAKLIHFNERRDFERAEECGLKALEIFTAIKDSSSMGDVYNNLGHCLSTQGRHDEALPYHLKQHELNLELNNVWGHGYSFSKLASIYAKQGKKELAESHLKQSIAISRKLGNCNVAIS